MTDILADILADFHAASNRLEGARLTALRLGFVDVAAEINKAQLVLIGAVDRLTRHAAMVLVGEPTL